MPFNGSRLFSTINGHLNELGLEPIDWKLDVSPRSKDLPYTALDGSRVLPNTTGIELGGLKGTVVRNLHQPNFEI